MVIVPLRWSEGHIWTTTLETKDLPEKSAFKFVIREFGGAIKWENGDNREFDIKSIQNTLNSNQEKGVAITVIKDDNIEMEFDSKSQELTLTYSWGK